MSQGCPLSGLLFVLGLEVLACSIRDNPNVRGIDIHGNEIKLSQFADDTICYLKDKKSVSNLLEQLELFGRVSGLKINTSKTKALWLGCTKDCTEKPFGFKWSEKSVLALGIHFSYDKKISNKLNFYDKLDKLKDCLYAWKKRKLTLLGRNNIVKTLGLSKLVFNASVLPLPKDFAAKVNELTFSFIWQNKPPKIKRGTIIGPKGKGGLDMVCFKDLDKALKINWVKRLANDSFAPWKIIPLACLK